MRRDVQLTPEIEALVNRIFDRRSPAGTGGSPRLARVRNAYRKACFADTYLLSAHVARASVETPHGARVLDAGAGEQQYRWLFDHTEYVSCDFGRGDDAWNYSGLGALCDLEALPWATETFDVCLLTEVLEHLARPDRVMAEVARTLRPGGRVYVTVPFAFPEHQVPHDFHRYTSFALRRLAETNGLVADEVVMRTGLAGFLAFYLDVGFESVVGRLPERLSPAQLRLAAPVAKAGRAGLAATKAALYLADGDSGICVGFNCVFTKPAS